MASIPKIEQQPIQQEAVMSNISADTDYGQYQRQALDAYSNILLREAYIGNPNLFKNINGSGANDDSPVSPNTGTINEDRCQAALCWTDRVGGICNPNGQGHSNCGNYTEFSPEDHPCPDDTHNGPIVPILSPLCWYNGDNWMGIRWLPPMGARCVVGFGKDYRTYILGYFVPPQKLARPIIKPGEILMKGYGNNYIHFRQSSKIDIIAGSTEGEQDTDDCYGSMSSASDHLCAISVNANKGYISFMVDGTMFWLEKEGIRMAADQGKSSITMDSKGVNIITTGALVTTSKTKVESNGSSETNPKA